MITGAKLKIFLAGDEAPVVTACKARLLDMGYTAVFSFGNPGTCLKRLSLKPDLVILPVIPHSPEAKTLLKKIVAFNRHTMVVFMGGIPESRFEAAVRRAERRKRNRLLRQAIGSRLLSGAGALVSLFSRRQS